MQSIGNDDNFLWADYIEAEGLKDLDGSHIPDKQVQPEWSGLNTKSINKKNPFIQNRFYHLHVGRRLTDEERGNHLWQKSPAPIPVAWHNGSVIRMNSTFLECVDANFLQKGLDALLAPFLFFFFICILFIIVPWLSIEVGNKLFSNPLGWVMYLTLLWVLCHVFGMMKHVFSYTHFPIRFNRKTRMVHVFLDRYGQHGRIFSVPWNNIYFTCPYFGGSTSTPHPAGLGKVYVSYSALIGLILAEDSEYVEEAFALSISKGENDVDRFRLWEFVRQYMEGDDYILCDLADMVDEVVDIAERRETPKESFRRAWNTIANVSSIFAIFLLPIIVLSAIGRRLIMYVNKKPIWPPEIEATCQHPVYDPILRDAKHLSPRGFVKPPVMWMYEQK